ncbi:hypothetical protein AMTR_s00096p00105200 [Amborella trichopoda]|uniref:Uncharacterized protein n=1 Tax=Amborella trichopoda TaxID=13333 RepID=W1P603_AMBTC|nr:hypothetical protein AMTR_s00096p00105200 [Amborella trichopoda]
MQIRDVPNWGINKPSQVAWLSPSEIVWLDNNSSGACEQEFANPAKSNLLVNINSIRDILSYSLDINDFVKWTNLRKINLKISLPPNQAKLKMGGSGSSPSSSWAVPPVRLR